MTQGSDAVSDLSLEIFATCAQSTDGDRSS
jgi:hypothetical protein